LRTVTTAFVSGAGVHDGVLQVVAAAFLLLPRGEDDTLISEVLSK
jgi:hypothetical protein